MIYATTGHRLDKLGGYTPKTRQRLSLFAHKSFEYFSPSKMLIGMALGWDQAIAQACLTHGIPYIACVPCDNQDFFWSPEDKSTYRMLLDEAEDVVQTTHAKYQPYMMHVRNRYMVDHAQKLVCLWDGSAGGTAHCVRFAVEMKKEIIGLWPQWVEFNRVEDYFGH